MRRIGLLTLCPLVLSLVGCPPTGSDAIRTDALSIVYNVVQIGDRAELRADFHVGSELGTPLQLSGGDEVSVNGTILNFTPNIFFPRYSGTVVAADEYRFELNRTGEEPYISTVRPTLPVTITAPVPEAVISREAGFAVAWEDPQPESPMRYEVVLDVASVNCSVSLVHGVDGVLADTFGVTDFLSEVLDEAGEPTGETIPVCEGETLNGTLAVDSFNTGEMDPGLRGRIRAATRTSVDITLLP